MNPVSRRAGGNTVVTAASQLLIVAELGDRKPAKKDAIAKIVAPAEFLKVADNHSPSKRHSKPHSAQ